MRYIDARKQLKSASAVHRSPLANAWLCHYAMPEGDTPLHIAATKSDLCVVYFGMRVSRDVEEATTVHSHGLTAIYALLWGARSGSHAVVRMRSKDQDRESRAKGTTLIWKSSRTPRSDLLCVSQRVLKLQHTSTVAKRIDIKGTN